MNKKSSDNVCLPSSYDGRIATELVNMLALTDLQQKNKVKNVNGRTLDLILTNSSNLNMSDASPLSRMDPHHPPLSITLTNNSIKFLKTHKTTKVNFHKINYDYINQEISAMNWNNILNNDMNVDSMVSTFYDTITKLIDKYAPKIRPKSDKYPKWFSSKLITLLKEKECYRSLYRVTNLNIYKDLFAQKRRSVKYELRHCENKYLQNIESNIATNPKAFFAYTKSLSQSNKIPNVMNYKNYSSDDPQTISNFFATHFESVYVENDNVDIADESICNCSNHLRLTEKNISEVISGLKPNKPSSPDGIPILFYKNTTVSITKPLLIIFNKSLQTNHYPTMWKKSFIAPIHKKGDKANIVNYRPVSIISAISKIFEKILQIHILSLTQRYMAPQQHGFTAKKSTVTNLTEFSDYLAVNVANGGQVDAAQADLSSAFDQICHNILLMKLKNNFGICKCLISLLDSFLSKREQIVCINGILSRSITPTSSVPQGSILSPLLFSLFINDLPQIIKCHILMFADDVKLFQKIKSFQDCLKLQADLIKLNEWCTKNKLKLNISKCFSISFSRRNDIRILHYDYRINNSVIQQAHTIKDLGVLFDEKLSFSPHVNSIITRAFKALGFITRSLQKFSKIETYKRLYYTYVRSILEYASPVWNPYYDIYTDAIEKVQRKFTRIVCFKFQIQYTSYEMRLNKLNMITLFNIRLFADEMLLFKIVNGLAKTKLADSTQSSIHI